MAFLDVRSEGSAVNDSVSQQIKSLGGKVRVVLMELHFVVFMAHALDPQVTKVFTSVVTHVVSAACCSAWSTSMC